ncbi:MAG: hypothetical protein GY862_22165, partial [Gammaproteobacteria bacterium]|nr:hypothetical protein [Gammaproteobacteria bacterium]
MPSLNWKIFDSLPGSKSQNFENLCRGLMRLHFGRYGQFRALANQPGVEFHIKLAESCSLASPPRWFGWQCKVYTRNQNGDLKTANHKLIESSLRKTEKYLPDITDWVLWTPYTLSKKDQDWYYALSTKMRLHLWTEEDVETYLSGDGLILRGTYFDELVLAPSNLEEWHRIAIQPIRERWLQSVHQAVEAERTIRRMLGETGSWNLLIEVGERLKKVSEVITHGLDGVPTKREIAIASFATTCLAFADTLTHFHEILAQGDLDIIQQKLNERKSLLSKDIRAVPRQLRSLNRPVALDATNALADMRIAQELLDEAEEFLSVGLVAVLAEAGGGKTHMAAQLTASRNNRPAGVFFHGRALHKGQTLDDLARTFSLNGKPVPTMEGLLAALDAAGKRAGCRLPILIDGLNEAENPKDWKFLLAPLSEAVKRYPNVLVVCTLRTGERQRGDRHWEHQAAYTENRESFAVMALPDDIGRIESKGFGGDVDEAIKKYFKHFKINSKDAEIPVEPFQRPLTLRIFCEVTNPKRASEVKIDYFPVSLSQIFEKYIANAAERISQMVNLSHSYSTAEIGRAIYVLGIELWKSRSREISDTHYRVMMSDTPDWNSSIVNLLAQEGLLFRNPGTKPYEYVITPIYDALGGHLIANALLTGHARDRSFNWLNEAKTMAMFIGENTHELASDTFKSLVALTPCRMFGEQIWKVVSGPLRLEAIMSATNLDAEYLDQETVAAILSLLKNSPEVRNRLFSRLQATRGSVGYPLNADFLDSALRVMPVHERDLSWTEWIRREQHEILNDLLAMERRWKQELGRRTPSDQLRAKWVMWLLTSTIHELRDMATRALYWFGRGSPEALFDESIRAFEINDPYVPERMLAASYGVAMALHVDLSPPAFATTTLPKYARRVFDAMFAKNASFSTTHSLIREYGSRIVEIALLYNPELFTPEEIQRSKPPFKDGGLRKWGEKNLPKGECYGFDSPFHMDFENYTIGRLIPDRGNYDFQHEEYCKVRAQILWRIEQLGWSYEQFKEVERSTQSQRYNPRMGADGKRTDRYGKKYSWIAFFEMSGFLHDLGQNDKRYEHERTWDVDIDPSFPECLPEACLIQTDFLGDPDVKTQEWIANGALPDITPYLQMSEVQNQTGSWIALDGFVAQEDESRGRTMFCFIRSFLVAAKEADSFSKHLSEQNLEGRWLPEKPSLSCMFAGEIPWCTTFSENGLTEISFVVKEETVKAERMQKAPFLDEKELDLSETDLSMLRFGIDVQQHDEEQPLSEEDLERIELREIPVIIDELKQEFAKYNVLVPVHDFSWESHHSVTNDAGHATTLAKEISSDLELTGQPQTFDLFTNDGLKATCGVSDRSNDFNNTQSLFFIREDLLKIYLKKKELALIWAMWGEREYSSDQINEMLNRTEHSEQV